MPGVLIKVEYKYSVVVIDACYANRFVFSIVVPEKTKATSRLGQCRSFLHSSSLKGRTGLTVSPFREPFMCVGMIADPDFSPHRPRVFLSAFISAQFNHANTWLGDLLYPFLIDDEHE